MRRHKVVTLTADDKTTRDVVVKEVSVRMVLDAFASDDGPAAGMAGLARECCGLDQDELLALYGSDLALLWEAFREVNGFFFELAPKLGLDGLAAGLGRNFARICGEESASLLRQATREP